jgi:hypothetical protein
VREVAGDLVVAVQKDDLCGHVSAGAPVLEDEAVDAGEELDRLEVQLRIPLEPGAK